MRYYLWFLVLCSNLHSQALNFPLQYLKAPATEDNYQSGLPGVDCIYIINLDKHARRFRSMQDQLAKYDLVAKRIRAVNGWDFNKQQLKRLYHDVIHPGPKKFAITPGQIGCFLSHLTALKDALENHYKVIWILEDDCDISADPKSTLSKMILEFSSNNNSWDILYTDTGSRFYHDDGSIERYDFNHVLPWLKEGASPKPKDRLIVSKDVEWVPRRLGMYSVLISEEGIKKIWSYFMQHQLKYAYDVDINFIANKRFFQTKQDIVSTRNTYGSSTSKKDSY